jgi:hypothetical protein
MSEEGNIQDNTKSPIEEGQLEEKDKNQPELEPIAAGNEAGIQGEGERGAEEETTEQGQISIPSTPSVEQQPELVEGGGEQQLGKKEEGEGEGEGEEKREQGVRPSEQKRRRRSSIKKIQTAIGDISKQLEKQTSQIDKINQILQPMQKQMKSTQRQPELINQIRSQVNQIQKQVSQVQKSIQKKDTLRQKSSKKGAAKKRK